MRVDADVVGPRVAVASAASAAGGAADRGASNSSCGSEGGDGAHAAPRCPPPPQAAWAAGLAASAGHLLALRAPPCADTAGGCGDSGILQAAPHVPADTCWPAAPRDRVALLEAPFVVAAAPGPEHCGDAATAAGGNEAKRYSAMVTPALAATGGSGRHPRGASDGVCGKSADHAGGSGPPPPPPLLQDKRADRPPPPKLAPPWEPKLPH